MALIQQQRFIKLCARLADTDAEFQRGGCCSPDRAIGSLLLVLGGDGAAKSDAGPPTILINKFDAGSL